MTTTMNLIHSLWTMPIYMMNPTFKATVKPVMTKIHIHTKISI